MRCRGAGTDQADPPTSILSPNHCRLCGEWQRESPQRLTSSKPARSPKQISRVYRPISRAVQYQWSGLPFGAVALRGVCDPAYRPMDVVKADNSGQKLHHLGFVVADIAAGMKGFVGSLAATWDGRVFEDPHQKVKVAFLSTRAGDPLIELAEPAAEDSPVRRFLTERGGGLHHVCYEVGDLEEQMAEMKARRCTIVRRPKPAIAFDGRRIAWVLTAEKLLVELLEKGNPRPT